MTNLRLESAIAEAHKAPFRLGALLFLTMLGVRTLFEGLGVFATRDFGHSFTLSATFAGLFVLLLRRRRR